MSKSSEADLPVEQLSVKSGDVEPIVLPLLLGTVFHVTSLAALANIVGSGAVRSNKDRSFPFTFPQSDRSYGRQRGYVCLFDFREVTEDAVREARGKFNFLRSTYPAFLFLDPPEYARLIPWTEAPKGAMVIPHVETWYPGDVHLRSLTHALVVTIEPDDADSAFRRTMRQLHEDADNLLDSGLVHIGASTVAELKSRAEEWTNVARKAGLEIDQDWEHRRVEQSAAGYGISLHARRSEHWQDPIDDSESE